MTNFMSIMGLHQCVTAVANAGAPGADYVTLSDYARGNRPSFKSAGGFAYKLVIQQNRKVAGTAMATEAKPIEIVVVEDSREDADLVGMVVQEHQIPCRMRVIRDGAKAIELLNALDGDPNAPQLDLFIVDMHLPKRSGEDVLRRLRSTERYAQCPVIVMTGLDSPMVEGTAMKQAALVYFRKPSTLEEYMQLGPMIRQVLRTNARDAS